MESLWSLPPELLTALWTALVAVATWFGRSLIQTWRRGADRDWDEVVTLRKALDRLRRRENAYATGFEIVLLFLPPELTADQRRAVARVRQVFETALLSSDGEREA